MDEEGGRADGRAPLGLVEVDDRLRAKELDVRDR